MICTIRDIIYYTKGQSKKKEKIKIRAASVLFYTHIQIRDPTVHCMSDVSQTCGHDNGRFE